MSTRTCGDGTTATATCVAPGVVRTRVGGPGPDRGFSLSRVRVLAKPFPSNSEEGADTLIWLATAPEAASLGGEDVSRRRPATPQQQALDVGLAADPWALCERLCADEVTRAA